MKFKFPKIDWKSPSTISWISIGVGLSVYIGFGIWDPILLLLIPVVAFSAIFVGALVIVGIGAIVTGIFDFHEWLTDAIASWMISRHDNRD